MPRDYEYRTVNTQNGKPVRVYARKNAVSNEQIDFSLNVAQKTIDYFENVYFGISEALPPKIDLIGFPQFPSGAMGKYIIYIEHWGLI